jgi:hypothetical protein
MTDKQLTSAMTLFISRERFRGSGALSTALVVTQHAKRLGLPLNPESLVTGGGGQVLGLGKSAVQSILARHGIKRILSKEAGRTNRGSLGNMKDYVAFLNSLAIGNQPDLDAVELFWIAKVIEFFAGKPLKLRVDPARGLRAMVADILGQAQEKRKSNPGVHYVGAVMQHLVGAKLDCALGIGQLTHNSFSTSDDQTGRAGDFLIGTSALHVTASPSSGLMAKCQANIGDGLRPVIVTAGKGVNAAESLAESAEIGGRIDVFDVEQFIALNLYEIGRFDSAGSRVAIDDLISRYNQIVENVETDPSLLIEIRQ